MLRLRRTACPPPAGPGGDTVTDQQMARLKQALLKVRGTGNGKIARDTILESDCPWCIQKNRIAHAAVNQAPIPVATADAIEEHLLPLLCDAGLTAEACEDILETLFPALGLERPRGNTEEVPVP